MKKFFIILGAAIGGIFLIIIVSMPFLNAGMNDVKSLVINDVDLTKVASGNFTGSYHKGRWTYDVEVKVENHSITSVKCTNGKMEPFAEFNKKAEAACLLKQSPKIDVVSGATVHTKAFSKAVENALESGIAK